MRTVCILGSTGSIGQNTLDVIRRHPDKYRVHSLVAHRRVETIYAQCLEFRPQYALMSDPDAAAALSQKLKSTDIQVEVLSGLTDSEGLVSSSNVDIVMAAIVGAAGLLPTLAAVKAGKQVLLANKEALVMSGALFMDAAREYQAKILPIDSEHNAIFQSLSTSVQSGEQSPIDAGIQKLLLTGSGGPFLHTPLEQFPELSVQQAVAHPNWSMGQKISVDSATMMNKGLEFIEARWLFDVQPNDIQVVIHPQSMIHSMVQYVDGSVIAQLGQPDMRTPIAYGLAYPERIEAGVAPLDFTKMLDFTFTQPEQARFPCLYLAIEACCLGQAASTVLNAANEIAVEAFLQQQIKFTDIAIIVEQTLTQQSLPDIQCIDDVLSVDAQARLLASQLRDQKAI
ncbi:1-deoxy-D-xylulose-5-phosphate reductoisomerase [Algicola sagamiensis]|uniref:1-deoxy-D-xylulose-5-phosphate reductoisomerase n=1 Tax=Algicola sagamiensis TaxID=163869 RepID=UPI00037ED220|nr:1-deoxy-D-xylulose-5-phosphate reductoisomerase [Algicola sagamiensis]